LRVIPGRHRLLDAELAGVEMVFRQFQARALGEAIFPAIEALSGDTLISSDQVPRPQRFEQA
jgi:hypothetical protein